MGTEVHGLNIEEGEEDKDHERRTGRDGEDETTLLERVRSCRLEEHSRGSNLGLREKLLRGLRRGREGETEKAAALCIFEI